MKTWRARLIGGILAVIVIVAIANYVVPRVLPDPEPLIMPTPTPTPPPPIPKGARLPE